MEATPMPTPNWRFAPPMPWKADEERIDDLIRVHSTAKPYADVCFVPINGNLLAANTTVALIVAASMRGAL